MYLLLRNIFPFGEERKKGDDGLSFIRAVVLYYLWTSHFVLEAQSFLDFNVYAVAQANCYRFALINFVIFRTFYNIDKGGVAAKLDGTLWHDDDLCCFG